MNKINQRVINLNKIDSPEKAFLIGYCCLNTEFNYFKKSLDKNEIHIEIEWKDEKFENLKNFFVEHFDAEVIELFNSKYAEKIAKKLKEVPDFNEPRYAKILKSYNLIIKITEDSKIWFTGKLPTVKKDLYPHLISGLLMKNGFITIDGNLQIIQFMNKHGLELLKKQLYQWYNIESSEIITKTIEGRTLYILELSPLEYVEKLKNVIVSDYKELTNNIIFNNF